MNKTILVSLLFAFLASSAQAACTQGQNGCQTCNQVICSQCDSTHVLDDSGACQAPIPNCTLASSATPGTCSNCANNFSIAASGACCTTTSNCAGCTSATAPAVCTSCDNTRTLDENGACQLNINNCTLISGSSSTKCKTCASGYGVSADSTSCVQCTPSSNCSSCAGATPGVCTTCALTRTLDENNYCQLNINNCTLISGSSSTKCKTCATGYGASSDSSQCLQCTPVSNCASCNGATPTVCLSCGTGYTLSTSTNTCAANTTNSALLVATSLILASLLI